MSKDNAMSKEFVVSQGRALSQGKALPNGDALSNETAENALANTLTQGTGEQPGTGAQGPSSEIALSKTSPTVTTDKADYAPGETVEITLAHVKPGTAYTIQIADAPADPGDDGVAVVYPSFIVVDGGEGDLDGLTNGKIVTTWTVPTDGSPNNATLNLTVTDAAGHVVATTTFTDAPESITYPDPVVTVTHDETTGLQNPTATPADTDDNDTSLALPEGFSTRLGTVLSATAATETEIGRALSGYTGGGGNTGSNVFNVTFPAGATQVDLAFVGSDGQALSGIDSNIDTVTGKSIWLYTDSSNNNILLGRVGSGTDGETADPTGAIAFAVYIEETGGTPPTGGKLWLVQYEPLKHPVTTDPDDFLNLYGKVYVGTSENLEFSLANAPSGQNLFLIFTTANPTTFDDNGVTRISGPSIIATGKDPADQSTGVSISTGDTINTSQAGGPTTFGTNNQMIVEGEGVRFTFVTGAKQNVTIPNLDQNEADLESNIDFTGMFGARSADFDVVQLQSGKSAVVKVTAYQTAAEPGGEFINGYLNDTEVYINSVTVSFSVTSGKTTTAYSYLFTENADGTVTVAQPVGPTKSASNFGLSADFTGNAVTISGVKANYNIQYTTSSDHHRVLVENNGIGSGQDSADFDIGGFSLLQVVSNKLEIGSKIIFEDDAPVISGTTSVSVDEEGLGGNAGDSYASGDLAGVAVTATGTLGVSFGADGAATTGAGFTLAATGATWDAATRTLTGADSAWTVVVQTNGSYTFTLLKPLTHATANTEDDAVITVTFDATDKDGDVKSGSFTVTVDDDAPVVTANNAVQLDDDAVNGNAGGTGDDADATNVSGTLGMSFGADGAGSVAWLTTGNPAGFTYELSGTNLLIKQGLTTVLTLTVNSTTGAYTVTQNAPIQHTLGSDENNQAFTINYRVTDGDGDTADGTLAINVDDDTPVLSFGNLVGTGTTSAQRGYWTGNVGADQPGNLDMTLNSFQLVKPDGTTVNGSSFTFSEGSPSPDGSGNYVFNGSLTGDFDALASTADTTVNFTMTVFADGHYELDLVQGLSSTVTLSSANGKLGAGGPDPVQTLNIESNGDGVLNTADEQIVFFDVLSPSTTTTGQVLTAIGVGASDLTEAQLQVPGAFPFITGVGAPALNVSTSGIGLGNNNLDGSGAGISATDESFVINPETLLTAVKVYIDNSVGGYSNAPGGTEQLYYRVFYSDGTWSEQTLVTDAMLSPVAGGQELFTIQTAPGKLIDAVQLTMGNGTVKIPVIEFVKGTENATSDVKLDFTATLTDADGDSATSNFSTDLSANELSGSFEYLFTGDANAQDTFNVNLAAAENDYQVQGWNTGDKLVLLGATGATTSINNDGGTDAIVTINEAGGQVTTVTVLGVDLMQTDLFLA